MTKKILITSIITATVAGAAAAALFVPHTVTVKEYMDGGMEGYKPKNSEIRTTLFDSMKNPIEIKARNIDHAVLTGMTVDGNRIEDGKLSNVYKDETVSVSYKPAAYTAVFKEDGKTTYTTSFAYGEEPTLPETAFLTSEHPYEDFKEWKKEDSTETLETGTDDLSVVYDAVYEGKTYKIEYDLDGGTANNPDSYQYGVGIDSLNNASKNGYTFDGWYSDEGKANQVTSISKDTHDDLKLYAKFHENPKPVARQTTNGGSYGGKTAGNGGGARNYSASPANSGSAGNSAPVASGPNFPYIGSAGAVTLSNGYSVALNYGTNNKAAIDAPYSAAYSEQEGNEIALGPNGENLGYVLNGYMYIQDHNYGVPAALPGTTNSNTMWLRHADGTVETLHKTYTFKTATQSLTCIDGRNFADGGLVHQYGRLVFRTCNENSDGGCVVTIWD